ncbi:outer membrane lipoprotein carrier protein LolA [Streptomyces longispororuber]|uniref:LolA family protein n=1 Tax=Streptomyces longispororuber TaxID=68230 RepID=UPI0036F6A1F3
MAPYESEQDTTEAEERSAGRRKAARYLVPVAVAGVAAATIGLVPALASGDDPDLPKLTAQELIEKIAASDTERLSGTVKINTDLGLPSLGGAGAGAFAPGGSGGGGGEDGDDKGSAADPGAKLMELASGSHTLRVAADGPEKQKISVLDDAAEYSVIHNGDDVWAYDSASNEAYHAKDAGRKARGGEKGELPKEVPATPKDFAEQALEAADETTSVTVDGSAKVAGRDAYRLVLTPKDSGTTVGRIAIAVDAKTGTPLKFTLTPAGGGAAVVDAGFTKVDFGRPAADTFDFTPPKGTKVTEEGSGPGEHRGGDGKDVGEPGVEVIGEGWTSVAKIKLPGGQGLPAPGSTDMPADAQRFLDSLGDKVDGAFGSGTVFKTRLVNALVTDDGTVYAGAVTKDTLVKAAESDR